MSILKKLEELMPKERELRHIECEEGKCEICEECLSTIVHNQAIKEVRSKLPDILQVIKGEKEISYQDGYNQWFMDAQELKDNIIKENNVLNICERFAQKHNYEFQSINKQKDGSYRINFKEYDGDGYIIHKIKLLTLLDEK